MTNITKDIFYVGANDHEVDLFEGQYKVPNGMAYNSYVIIDDKIAVMDTIDKSKTDEWIDNVQLVLGNRKPDYLIVQHMEPDHSSSIDTFLKRFPDTCVVGNIKTFTMIAGFFPDIVIKNTLIVENMQSLSLGNHKLTFAFAPMVHWPEVMMTYDATDKVLFSADGFGKFGALDAVEPWEDEARRYYIGIVGKYGQQVQNVLKLASTLDISIICPLHGPVLDKNLEHYIHLYDLWSSYTPEDQGVCICYTSVYGHTAEAVTELAANLRKLGAPKVIIHDLARCDISKAVEDAFRYDKLVLATTTYNAGIFPYMLTFINKLTERNFQNRTVAMIENGSWAPMAKKVMAGLLANSKNLLFAENNVTIKSAVTAENKAQLAALAEELCETYMPVKVDENHIDPTALFHIGYGLYVVTSNDGTKDNGLIVNTVTQVTNSPNRVAVTVNKLNYSCEVISKTKLLNISTLSQDAPFKIFQHFGFRSGRDNNKFADYPDAQRSVNGLMYLTSHANAFISCCVINQVDLGTHIMFICDVTQCVRLSDAETMTYTYYQKNVKPRPESEKKGYVCKICGYVYEGDQLPADFICPLCKHGAEDFEPVG